MTKMPLVWLPVEVRLVHALVGSKLTHLRAQNDARRHIRLASAALLRIKELRSANHQH